MSLNHMHIRQYENTCPPRDGVAEAIQEGSLTIKPVLQSDHSAFGAEVFGVDWSKPVPEEIVAQVSYNNVLKGSRLTMH